MRMDGSSRFASEAAKISEAEPELVYVINNDGVPIIRGNIVLCDEGGSIIDRYEVEIVPVENYPFYFPLVFETAGRIPINIDWHMFPDGHCCIKALPEELLLCKQGITLEWFIKTQVRPYFFNQKHKEVHGYFLNERSHGSQGNIDFFEEVFQTRNLKDIVKYLAKIKSRIEPGRSANCFCGSGVKYRHCHRDSFRLLSKFDDFEIDYFAKMIIASPRFPSFI